MPPPRRWHCLALSSCCLLLLLLLPLLLSEAFLFPHPHHPHKEIQQQQQQQIQPQHPTTNNRHHLPKTINKRRRDPTIMATSATTSSSSSAVSPTAKDKLVVLTREAGKNDKLRARLEAREVPVLELPCIAHCHAEGYAKLQETLDTVTFDYVVITSPEAAHVFLEVAETCRTYKPTNLVSIGEATGDILRKNGGTIIYTPSKALAKVLVQELPEVEGGSRPAKVLYPASKRAAKTLEDGLHGRDGGGKFEVMRLNTYDTVPADWTEAETALAQGCSVVTFASPSALKVWTSRLGTGFKVACIGETTATAARENGWPEAQIYYPKEAPGIDGWADSVLDAMAVE